MICSSRRKRRKDSLSGPLFLGMLTILSLLSAACAGDGMRSGGPGLITPGILTVGSDTTYPPLEYIDKATGQVTGFDIDLITAMARRMQLKAKIITVGFDTIFDSLAIGRLDVIVSAVNITDERKQKFDFIPYFSAGESLLVQKGNPLNLKSVDDLCGQKVGVQSGTIQQDELSRASMRCVARGKSAIMLTALADQTDVVNLLANGRVAATYQDSPVTDYYVKQNPGLFDVGGSVVNAGLEGIVIRKGDPTVFDGVQTAFNQVKADGTYHQLILKWGLINEEITMR